MKKKNTLWTFIKRSLLILIALILVVVLSVFFLDRYKTSGTEFVNEYSDEYWENLEESGFVYWEDIFNEMDAADTGSGAYQFPYDETEVTDLIERLNSARYYKEVQEIYKKCKYPIIFKPDSKGDLVESYDENSLTSEYQSYANKDAFEARYTELLAEFRGYTYSNFKKDYYEGREILKNDRFRLIFNMQNTYFTLEELDAEGNVITSWNSIPEQPDSNLKSYQSSILSLTYVSGNPTESASAAVRYNTFTYSTDTTKNYYVNIIDEDENGEAEKVQVYYVLTDTSMDYTYFPEELTIEQIQELAQRCTDYVNEYIDEYGTKPKDSKRQEIEAFKFPANLNTDITENTMNFLGSIFGSDGYYIPVTDPETLETLYYRLYKYDETLECSQLQRFFVDWCNFTPEELREYTGSTGTVYEKPKVEIAIEYSLTEDGLQVMIPGNSVKTNANSDGYNYKVHTIDVLPYFTSLKGNVYSTNKTDYSGQLVEGYTIIPDGSGAILNFNSDKVDYSSYSKQIYTSDLAFSDPVLGTSTNDILLPLYACVYTGPDVADQKAIIAEFTDGAAQATISVDIPRVSAVQTNTFNYSYFTISFREKQTGQIGTKAYAKEEFAMYTTNAADGDYRINYNVLDLTKYEASYVGVAKFYRDELVERSEGSLNVNGDTTTNAVLDLEVIGSYTYDSNFLGIGYTAKGTMTTIEELAKILDEVKNLGINNINVYYYGWRNIGLVNTSFKNIKVSSQIGGKKELLKLISEYKDIATIYPQVEFIEYENYQESFGNTHYTTRDVTGAYAEYYPYELNSNVYNKNLNKIMSLSPAYYYAFANKLAKNYHKVLGIDTIAVSGLGSKLTGYYRQDEEMFKSAAVVEQEKAFEVLLSDEYGIQKVALETPYAYALQYASAAYNVPYESTKYDFLDYSIPFYQLVINGLFDYSGESINKNAEKGITEQLLRCIETGSNLSFTFTYDDSSELLQTDYNNYYYTLYTRWLEDVKEIYDEINGLGIYGLNLTNHTRLDNNVYKVVYTNESGTEKIEIIINYLDSQWTYADGTTIPAKSYKVLA